jgi:hypothetical protein
MPAPGFVVAMRGEQEHARLPDAPAKKSHKIQARLVRPVDVLQHDDRFALRDAQPGKGFVKRRFAHMASLDLGRRFQAQTGENFQDRTQRAWCGQGIAVAARDQSTRRHARKKRSQQRALADAGFSGNENGLSRARSRSHEFFIELLEKLHALE